MEQKVYKSGTEAAEAMQKQPLEQQMLHDFAMANIFTPENAAKAKAESEGPLFLKRGEKVDLKYPDLDAAEPRFEGMKALGKRELSNGFEVIGFLDENNKLVDDNPYNDQSDIWKQHHHPVRLRTSGNREFTIKNSRLVRRAK